MGNITNRAQLSKFQPNVECKTKICNYGTTRELHEHWLTFKSEMFYVRQSEARCKAHHNRLTKTYVIKISFLGDMNTRTSTEVYGSECRVLAVTLRNRGDIGSFPIKTERSYCYAAHPLLSCALSALSPHLSSNI